MKTILFTTIFISKVLQEAYSSSNRNNSVHSFLESGIIYECEEGFYNTTQILVNKNNNMGIYGSFSNWVNSSQQR
jgi:hypothetical protein